MQCLYPPTRAIGRRKPLAHIVRKLCGLCLVGAAACTAACGTHVETPASQGVQAFEAPQPESPLAAATAAAQPMAEGASGSPRATPAAALEPASETQAGAYTLTPEASHARPLSAASNLPYVTVDIASDARDLGPWPTAHMQCDGVRIAPGVILTAARCFAWHRVPDSDADVPPKAVVTVFDEARGCALQARYVAVHPSYAALACSQPKQSIAGACLRAASRCMAMHGRKTQARSACLQSTSAQVIESQAHGVFDMALVFVDGPQGGRDTTNAPEATVALVREPSVVADASASTVALYAMPTAPTAAAEAFTPLAVYTASRTQLTRTSFDIVWPDAWLAEGRARLFDAAVVPTSAATASGLATGNAAPALYLVGWASRRVDEMAASDTASQVRYARVGPHILWITDTIARVARAYPNLPSAMPVIVDIDAPK